MPITLQYQPRADLVADMAWQGGRGEFDRQQVEQAFRQQQADRAAFQQEQELAARIQAQNANRIADQQSQMFRARQQMGLMGYQRQNELADMAQRNQWRQDERAQERDQQVGDMNVRRGQQLEDMGLRRDQEQADLQARQDFAAQQADMAWQRGSVDDAVRGISDSVSQLSRERQWMTPEDQRQLADLAGKWTAIRAEQGKSPPQKYLDVLRGFADNLQKSGLHERIQRPKPTPEQLKEETTVVPGEGRFGRNRNGAWDKISDDPGLVAEKERAKYVETLIGAMDTTNPDSPKPMYSDEQIKEMLARRDRLLATPKPPPPGPVATPPVAAEPAPSPPQAQPPQEFTGRLPEGSKLEVRNAWIDGKKGYPITKLPDGRFASRDDSGNLRIVETRDPRPGEPDHTRPYVWGEAYSQPTGPTPKHINQLPPDMAEYMVQTLPKPQTPEDAERLPRGTVFLLPDGRIGRVK